MWNCVTPLFTPLEVQFSKNISFSKTYSSLIWNARLAPKVTFDPYRWKESGIFLSGTWKVTILRKVRRCLAFSRKWVGNHFYMAKWTLIYPYSNYSSSISPSSTLPHWPPPPASWLDQKALLLGRVGPSLLSRHSLVTFISMLYTLYRGTWSVD